MLRTKEVDVKAQILYSKELAPMRVIGPQASTYM